MTAALLDGTAQAIAAAVRTGAASAREIAQLALNRIKARNGVLGAFTDVTAMRALARADAIDAARAKAMTTLAGQVDRGAIDRAALAPVLKEEENAIVAARLREHSILERLHAVLTAKQVEEVGGGKDFLRPAKTEAEVRAKTEEHMNGRIDHLAKKLPTASAEERANIAAKLRARAAK